MTSQPSGAEHNQVTIRLTLKNKRGLHARASHKFVACASRFDAHIEVTSHNDVFAETVVADSVMELLLLGSAYGEDISIMAKGVGAQAAIDALKDLVDNRFGEGE